MKVGKQVDVLGQRGARPSFEPPGPAQDQGDVNGLFEEVRFGPQPVVIEHFSVVGREYDDRVFPQAEMIEDAQDLAEQLVAIGEAGVVALHGVENDFVVEFTGSARPVWPTPEDGVDVVQVVVRIAGYGQARPIDSVPLTLGWQKRRVRLAEGTLDEPRFPTILFHECDRVPHVVEFGVEFFVERRRPSHRNRPHESLRFRSVHTAPRAAPTPPAPDTPPAASRAAARWPRIVDDIPVQIVAVPVREASRNTRS